MSARVFKSGAPGEPRLEEPVSLVRHDVLQMTDIGDNNNKFFSLELHLSGASTARACIYTHYGRVGDAGRRETRYYDSLGQAKIAYNALHAQKTNKGYAVVTLQSSSIGSPLVQQQQSQASGGDTASGASSSNTNNIPSKLSPELQAIVTLLYEESAATLSGTISARITSRGVETPLGVLTLAQVSKGERVLDQIHNALQRDTSGNTLEQLSALFYSIVPHTVGRSKSAISDAVIRTAAQLEEKQELVQLMRDLVSVSSGVGGAESALVDQRYAALRCTIESITNTSEGNRIAELVQSSQRATSSLRVVNVYSVSRPGEVDDFTTLIENKKLLFHGSRASNMVGILSRGLLEPKRIIARGGQRTNFGWLGAGIYFGDASCTSVKYAHPAANGNRFMLVANVALGKSAQYTKITADLDDAPPGFNSTHGVRRTPERASDFDDDEFVVYRRDQQRLSYLVEFSVDASDVRAVQVAPTSTATTTTAATTAVTTAAVAPAPRMTAKAKIEELKRARAPIAAPSAFAQSKPAAATTSLFGASESTTVAQPTFAPSSFAAPVVSSSSSSASSSSFGGRGVAVAAAASSSVPKVAAGLSAADAKIQSDEDELRRLFVSDRDNARISSPTVHLIDVYADDGRSIVYEDGAELPLLLTQHRRNVATGGAAVVNRATFERKWSALTNDALARLNWSNVFVAGGAVLACMLPDEAEGEKDRFADTDIDMFLFGLSEQQAVAKLRHIYDTVVANCGETQVVRTGNAVTIIGGFPRRHIQLVLRLYKSPAEVLLGFDIDACAVGYDGKRVWAVPRSRRAIVQRRNIVDMTRRSLTYEVRLYKYSKRGFAVAVPGFERRRVDFAAVRDAARRPTTAKGLLRLLALEWAQLDKATGLLHQQDAHALVARRIAGQPPTSADDRILEYAAEAAREHGADESDYSDVFLPWGPQWMATRVIKMLEKRDRASMFSVRNPATGKVHHRHTFVSGIDNVISGRSLWCKLCRMSAPTASASFAQGPLAWVTENPGRQLLTGSFHPVDNDQWYDGGLLDADAQQISVARSIGALRGAPAAGAKRISVASAPTRRALSPLHWAAALGDLAAVQELLRAPLALEVASADDVELISPITLAAMNGHLNVAKALLANPKLTQAVGRSVHPIAAATFYGAAELVSLLQSSALLPSSKGFGSSSAGGVEFPPAIDASARLERPLFACAYELDVRALEAAALNGVADRDEYGVTALHVVAARIAPAADAVTACAQALLARGADVNAPDINGATPLHYAAQCGNVAMALVLLEHRAALDATNVVGHTPLDICSFGLAALLPTTGNLGPGFATPKVRDGHAAIRKLLVDRGATASVSTYDVPSLPPSQFIKTSSTIKIPFGGGVAAAGRRATKHAPAFGGASGTSQPIAAPHAFGGPTFGGGFGFGAASSAPTAAPAAFGGVFGTPIAAPQAFGQPFAAPHAFGQPIAAPQAFGGFGQPPVPQGFGWSQAPAAAPQAFGAAPMGLFGTPAAPRVQPGTFGTPATTVAPASQPGGLFGTPLAAPTVSLTVVFESTKHSVTIGGALPARRLKQQVSSLTEVGTNHLTLRHNGRDLDDDLPIEGQVGNGAQVVAVRDSSVPVLFGGKAIVKATLSQTLSDVADAVRRAQPLQAQAQLRLLWRGAELTQMSSTLSTLGFDENSPPITVAYRATAGAVASATAAADTIAVSVTFATPGATAVSLGSMKLSSKIGEVRSAYEAMGLSAQGGTFSIGPDHRLLDSLTLTAAIERTGHNRAQPLVLTLLFAQSKFAAPSTPSRPRQTTLSATAEGRLGFQIAPATPGALSGVGWKAPAAPASPPASGFGWQAATTPVRPGFKSGSTAGPAAAAAITTSGGWGVPATALPVAESAPKAPAAPLGGPSVPAVGAAPDLSGTRTPVAKLLLLVSHLFKRGSLTPVQRATLKRLVMTGEPALLAMLECFEVDADVEELLDSMRALCNSEKDT